MSVFDPSRRQLLIRSGVLAGAAALASLPGSAPLATPTYAASSHSKTPTGEEIRKAYRRWWAGAAPARSARGCRRATRRPVRAKLDGVVRWGGDDRKPDESLFYLAVKPGDRRLAEVVARLGRWRETPGSGAGAPVDVLAPKRRKAATSLARSQRAAA